MPRLAAFTPEILVDRALDHFWQHGYHATSMDDLVKITGVSRHGIYSAFGGKRELFLACFERYQIRIVSPAFHVVEAPGANLSQIEAYFEYQIARGEALGLPGSGCFVVNSATEVAPSDADVLAKVSQHQHRLLRGFGNALRNSEIPASLPNAAIDEIAEATVIFTSGLWLVSRTTDNADRLRSAVRIFLQSLKEIK